MNVKRTGLDILLTFARQFLSGLFQLLIFLIIARSLGSEGAGIFAVSLLIPTVLAQILNLGLPTSSVYFIASGAFERSDVWAATRDITGIIALIGTVLMYLGLPFAAPFLFPQIDLSLLLIVAVVFPFLLIVTNVAAIFQAVEDFRFFNIVILVQPALAFLLIFVFWKFDLLSIIRALIIIVASHMGSFIIALFLLSRRQRLLVATQMHKTYLKQALPYGLKAYLTNIVSLLNYRADLFFVNLFLGPAKAGLYAVAVRLVEQLWIISQSVSTVILPRLSAMAGDAVGKSVLTPAITRYVLWITFTAAGVLAMITAPLIGFLFGGSFLLASGALHILLPGVVFFSVARVLSNELAASGLVGINLVLALTVLTTNIVLNFGLIPVLGLSGAAVSTSVSYTLAFVVLLCLQVYRLNVPLAQFLILSPQDLTWIKGFFGKRAGNPPKNNGIRK